MRHPRGTLYGIEANKEILVSMPDPATGEIVTIGALGASTSLCAALDIDDDGTAYASLTHPDGSKLFTVNLTTGAATLIGTINISSPVQGIAVVTGSSAPQNRLARPVSTRSASFRSAAVASVCGDIPGE